MDYEVVSSDEDQNENEQIDPNTNPIKECLMKELHSVEEIISKHKQELVEIRNFNCHFLQQLSTMTINCSPSDSECDYYNTEGEPIIKKKRSSSSSNPLVIKSIWQRVVDRKWIIGVYLQNKSTWALTDISFYICFPDKDEVAGTSYFWERQDDVFWDKVSEIAALGKYIAATVVVDLPEFDQTTLVQIYGSIFYEIDGKLIQLPIDEIKLSVRDVMNGDCSLKFTSDMETNILATKSISVEKTVSIDLKRKSGEQLYAFLAKHSFTEIMRFVYVSKNVGSLQNTILEVLNINDACVNIRIYARNNAQVNIIVQTLRENFPELTSLIQEDPILIAAQALMQELELYFKNKNPADWQKARIKTDFLIP